MSSHYHGPKDRTSVWMYVPVAVGAVVVVGAVFASGFLQGGLAGKYTPVTVDTTASAAPSVNVQALAEPTPDLVRAGRQLYGVNCASCHGEEGYGDGTQGRGLNPPVRNFHEMDGWKNGANIGGMWTTLENGIPGGSMAAYRVMPPEDRIAIIHFIRQTFVPEPPETTQDDIAMLPAGGAAVSQDPDDVLVLDIPENSLPINFAMARLAQEAANRGQNR